MAEFRSYILFRSYIQKLYSYIRSYIPELEAILQLNWQYSFLIFYANIYQCTLKCILSYYSTDSVWMFTGTCVAGEQPIEDNCVACPIGTYKETTGTSACVPCPNGQVTDEIGTTSSSLCKGQVMEHVVYKSQN